MTTKLEPYSIDPLTDAPFASSLDFAACPSSIDQYYPRLRGALHRADMMLEFQKRESVRKTILMQEEIFRHQVQELHRIYDLQKRLMSELEKGLKRRSTAETRHSTSSIIDQKGVERIKEESEVEVELTLSIGTTRRRSKQYCSSSIVELHDSDKSSRGGEFGSCSTKRNKGSDYDDPNLVIRRSSGVCPATTRDDPHRT